MRHIKEPDSLGVNHHLHHISRRDSLALNEKGLRKTIRNIRPDYVYVHLGINDIAQGIHSVDTMKNFCSFKSFTDSIPGTKLMISLPLMTDDPRMNSRLNDLRNLLIKFVDWFPKTYPGLWGNSNKNFSKDGTIIKQFYHRDGRHLSEEGKRLILANMRHHIHLLTKTERQPVRTRAGISSQSAWSRPGSSSAR